MPKDQLAPGIESASRFTSVCINTAIYLPWLVGQCRKNGVVFKRAVIKHVVDAAYSHHGGKADLVVNCTGLSSRSLGGVTDSSLYPARGQIVVVRNDPGYMCMVSGCDDGDDEVVYVMARAAGRCRNLYILLGMDNESHLLTGYRGWYYSRRIIPETQLGSFTRPQSSDPHHETLR